MKCTVVFTQSLLFWQRIQGSGCSTFARPVLRYSMYRRRERHPMPGIILPYPICYASGSGYVIV